MSATETAATTLMKAGSQQSLIKKLAEKYDIEAGKFYNAIVSTVFPTGKAPNNGKEATPGRGLPPTEAMVMTFLIVCNQYDLNPFLREIYPFVDGEGNLKIIVGVDGWIKTALRQDDYDGHEFSEHIDADGNLFAVTCSVYRKDRTRPIKMVEYMKECKMGTTPWEKWPHRMLHHKAFIQACRYAFGMGDLTDEDELDRIRGGSHTNTILEEPRRLSEADRPALTPASSKAATPINEPEPTPVPKAQIPTGDSVTASNDAAVDEADIKRVWATAFPKGLSKVEVNTMIKRKFSVDRVQALNKGQLEELLADIQAL
jgi:phage recombination protein Bet